MPTLFPCVGNVLELTKKVEDMEKANQNAQTEIGKRNGFIQSICCGAVRMLMHVKVALLAFFFLVLP